MQGSVQLLSCAQLFATPWTTAHQASLSITNSRSPPKLMSIESPMPSNHLILHPFSSCPQSFPASGSFQMSQLFASSGQSIGVSASTSILPMNTQDWSPLGWTVNYISIKLIEINIRDVVRLARSSIHHLVIKKGWGQSAGQTLNRVFLS